MYTLTHILLYIYNINQYYTVLSLSFFLCGSDYPHDCCTVEGSGWEPRHLQSKWRELLLVKFKPHMYTLRPIKHPTWQLEIFSNRSTVYKYVLLILYIYMYIYNYIYIHTFFLERPWAPRLQFGAKFPPCGERWQACGTNVKIMPTSAVLWHGKAFF
jgi:hypothetical protein